MGKLLRKFRQPYFGISFITFTLIIVGLIAISSASAVLAKLDYNDHLYFVRRQIMWVVLGVGALLIFQKIDYNIWRRLAPILLLLNLFLLVAVFLPGIGYSYGGATRWIHIGPLFFQPTELLKPVLILYLACWLEKKGQGVKDFAYGFLPFVIMLSVIIILIMKQPDMGTMFVVSATAGVIFFVAGASIWQIGVGFISALFAFWELIKIAPYRMARFMVFLNPSADPQGQGYHINQALLAVGSGGIFGRGFGQSRQKYLYLPQPLSDSIFAIMAEELGFIRSIIILGLFAFLAWQGFRVAQKAPDSFSRLVACGITCWITTQALINIGTMLGIIPLTGIPLPFISYGGSSLVTSMVGIGILLSIARRTPRV